MLVPVFVRANYKITTSQVVTLESIVGSNLPLLFPEVVLHNRTEESCNVTVLMQQSAVYLNQSDPDFNGSVSRSLCPTFSLADGTSAKLTGLDNSLLPTSQSISNILTLSNAGPADEAWVSLVVRGFIESSMRSDPLAVVNV